MVNNFSKGFGEPFSAGLFAHRTGRQRSRASHWTARAWGLFVTVIGWRIAKRKHARAAFSGEGARLFGGRWNSPGTAMVYTAQSQSLAALEMIAQLDSSQLLASYVLFKVGIDES